MPNHFSTSNSQHAKTPSFRIAEDKEVSPAKPASIPRKPVPSKLTPEEPLPIADSGYYGSQSQNQDATVDLDEIMEDADVAKQASPEHVNLNSQHMEEIQQTPKTRHVLQETLTLADRSAKRENRFSTRQMEIEPMSSPTKTISMDIDTIMDTETAPVSSPVQLLSTNSPKKSPVISSPKVLQTLELENPDLPISKTAVVPEPTHEVDDVDADENGTDVTRSPSEGSSPIRPLVRKSSLNFASLPAREPLTSNKSLGARMSRVSHIDQTRASFYPRLTGGKSLGVRQDAPEDQDAMDIDEDDSTEDKEKQINFTSHSKTYTQRLQDQISMLGKSQAGGHRPKSIPNLTTTQQPTLGMHSEVSQQAQPVPEDRVKSPRLPQSTKTPGAFPDDDDEDWIAPPTTKQMPPQSPRPGIGKSFSADIMEGLFGKETVSSIDFDLPRESPQHVRHQSSVDSPRRNLPPAQHVAILAGHTKTVSVPDFSRFTATETNLESDLLKPITSSHPSIDLMRDSNLAEAPGSPSRAVRDSPTKPNALKQVKNKFSSILKGSKGLLASSAALSAEGKASLVDNPSATRLQKTDSEVHSAEAPVKEKETEYLYPDLTKHLSPETQPTPGASSPTSTNNRKTRAPIERERREQKQKDKEEREAQHRADQLEKLEKAREKERERAREIATERQVTAQKELERNTRTPAPKDAPKSTRTSPRKARAQPEAESEAVVEELELDRADLGVEMSDVPTSKTAPPSLPRATAGQTLKNRDIKRPIKPIKDASIKTKQAPTLIRVNTSSQNSGFHPSNSVLATTLQDTLGGSQQQSKSRPGQASVPTKPSLHSLKSSVSSTSGRPKALELAAKRKQQEEKEAQRRRDLKAEMERKREEDRRQEEERREKERQKATAEAEAKKIADRQVAIEKAKQTRAPPPAVRSQPNGPPEYNSVRDKGAIPRPPSRLQQSMAHRSQEDLGRPIGAMLANSSKMPTKRPLQHDGAEDGPQRPTAPRSGFTQQKEIKRMRLSDEFDIEEEMEIQSYGTNIKGPPVRPSAGFKKVSPSLPIPLHSNLCLKDMQDLPNKSMFSSGYAPATQSVTRDIFKASVAAHHTKNGHPLDMAQVSKGHIPFASSSQAAGSSHKTPARPAGVMATKSAAKSATRSSPRFQNGDNIELPEIQTDDEDDEEDETRALGQASWADTPELRRELMKQETIDPLQVFGPPAPLKLEEVFKNKDRWNKFRARTSSANWSGTDRLTEDEIRKDIAAREKMRRDGGWSYELSKDMA